jgi:hypothetical protein
MHGYHPLHLAAALALARACVAAPAAVREAKAAGDPAELAHAAVRFGCYYGYDNCNWSGVIGLSVAGIVLLVVLITICVIIARRRGRAAQQAVTNAQAPPTYEGKDAGTAETHVNPSQPSVDVYQTPITQDPNMPNPAYQPYPPQQYPPTHAQQGQNYPPQAYPPQAYPPQVYPPQAYSPPSSPGQAPPATTGAVSPPSPTSGAHTSDMYGSVTKPSFNDTAVTPVDAQAPDTGAAPANVYGSVINQTGVPLQPR